MILKYATAHQPSEAYFPTHQVGPAVTAAHSVGDIKELNLCVYVGSNGNLCWQNSFLKFEIMHTPSSEIRSVTMETGTKSTYYDRHKVLQKW